MYFDFDILQIQTSFQLLSFGIINILISNWKFKRKHELWLGKLLCTDL